jgi:hypothetical protein
MRHAGQHADFNPAAPLLRHWLRRDRRHPAAKHFQGPHAGGNTMRRQVDDETGWHLFMAHGKVQRGIGLQSDEHMVVSNVDIDGRQEG